jgi:hypothetical protein
LFKKRYAVSVIHSVRHFHAYNRDYGPMFNYSTFSFKSITGWLFFHLFLTSYLLPCTASFSRMSHGRSTVLQELIKNTDLFRQSSMSVSSSSFSRMCKLYVHRIHSSLRQALPMHDDIVPKMRLHCKIVLRSPNFFAHRLRSSRPNIFLYKLVSG